MESKYAESLVKNNGKFINSGNILGTSIDNDKYFLKYIYYCLLNQNELIQSYFRGSSVQHPDMKQIIQIRLPIPPIEEQYSIVSYLDDKCTKIDKMIEGNIDLGGKNPFNGISIYQSDYTKKEIPNDGNDCFC